MRPEDEREGLLAKEEEQRENGLTLTTDEGQGESVGEERGGSNDRQSPPLTLDEGQKQKNEGEGFCFSSPGRQSTTHLDFEFITDILYIENARTTRINLLQ